MTLLSDTKFTFGSPVSISFSKLDNSQFVRNCVALTFDSGKFHCYFEFLIACDYSKTERSWCLSRQLFFNTLLNLFMNRNWKCFIGRLYGKVSAQPHTIVKQICFPNGFPNCFCYCFLCSRMHNEGQGCAEILPNP